MFVSIRQRSDHDRLLHALKLRAANVTHVEAARRVGWSRMTLHRRIADLRGIARR